jgi:hypothetical protein
VLQPFQGIGIRGGVTRRSPSGNRANAGLNDPIPSGLKTQEDRALEANNAYSIENSEEPFRSIASCIPTNIWYGSFCRDGLAFAEARARQGVFFEKLRIRNEEGKEGVVDSSQSDLIRPYPG